MNRRPQWGRDDPVALTPILVSRPLRSRGQGAKESRPAPFGVIHQERPSTPSLSCVISCSLWPFQQTWNLALFAPFCGHPQTLIAEARRGGNAVGEVFLAFEQEIVLGTRRPRRVNIGPGLAQSPPRRRAESMQTRPLACLRLCVRHSEPHLFGILTLASLKTPSRQGIQTGGFRVSHPRPQHNPFWCLFVFFVAILDHPKNHLPSWGAWRFVTLPGSGCSVAW